MQTIIITCDKSAFSDILDAFGIYVTKNGYFRYSDSGECVTDIHDILITVDNFGGIRGNEDGNGFVVFRNDLPSLLETMDAVKK